MDYETEDTGKTTEMTGLEIAITGMAVRLPGVADINEFWENLKNGVESITFFSPEQLDELGVSDEMRNHPYFVPADGKMDGVEFFDAAFFDYTHWEAEIMDPQLRLFHEVTWNALENAGYDPLRYDRAIGLYAGASPNPMWELQAMTAPNDGSGSWLSISQLTDKDFLGPLVSYRLNLTGPSFPVYTACSTSLVAIHLAVQGLLGGECDMAVAGGVKVTFPRKGGYIYHEGLIQSPDGHCRPFDARAKGTVGAEGAGVVILKRMDDALEDGDHIYAMIKGSAINNDGKRKVGFTAPSIRGQIEVITSALRMGEVPPESISYIETHGTATPLGDPVEIDALNMAYKEHPVHTCPIGSAKSNIGHADSAAGAAGLIKTVLALYNRMIPPSLHFEEPNPEIAFQNSPFYVITSLKPWLADKKYPRRAGVSSFGIGGTNAHIILEEAPPREPAQQGGRYYKLFLLSAKSPTALERNTAAFGSFLKENPDLNPADMAFTLQVGRGEFKYRRMAVCTDNTDAAFAFSPEEKGTYDNSERLKTAVRHAARRFLVFMFSGQATQYVNMGAGLYRGETVFRETLDRCFDILNPLMKRDLRELLYPGGSEKTINGAYPTEKDGDIPSIMRQEFSQPIIFAFEYALATLLMSWGVRPDAMIGYSLGEYVAACLADVISLEDALELMVFRGALLQDQPPGAMLSVPLTEEKLQPLLDAHPEVSLAAVNEPSCTVAASPEAMAAFEADLKKIRVMGMRLNIFVAGHSMELAAGLEQFETMARRYTLSQPGIPVVSSVTGDWLTPEQAADPVYWGRHMKETVRFAQGICRILEMKQDKHPLFIEIGPGRNLAMMVKRYADQLRKENNEIDIVNMVRAEQQDLDDMFYTADRLGRLWLYGVSVDWKKYYSGEKRRRIPLPGYAFDKIRYWPDATTNILFQPQESGESRGKKSEETVVEPPEAANMKKYPRAELSSAYEAPETDSEKQLAAIWENFFRLDRVGLDDDFFELGGDSLKAVTVVNVIHRATDVRVPLEVLFRESTVRKLAVYVDHAEKDEFMAIERVDDTAEIKYYPLSPAQKRFFLLQQVDPDNAAYNLTASNILAGPVDRNHIETVFNSLIERHESFRTSFQLVDGEAVQEILPEVHLDVAFEDLRDAGNEEQIMERALSWAVRFSRAFDLAEPPLLRVGLFRIADEEHVLVVDMPHIITDGTSLAILIKDFLKLYNGESLPPLALRYRDYSYWLANGGLDRIEKARDFWLDEFGEKAGDIPVSVMPYDFPRPSVQSFAGRTVVFDLDTEVTAALRAASHRAEATMFMTLMAVHYIFIYRLTGQEDIVFGTPVAGRFHPDLQSIVGIFINTLALRNRVDRDISFDRFLTGIKTHTVEAFDHQEYPFEELVEQLTADGRLPRDASRNPLFDLFFTLENAEDPGIETPGLTVKPFPKKREVSIFDLSLFARLFGDGVYIRFEYCTKLFKEDTIRRFTGYFKRIASIVAAQPGLPIGEIDFIPEDEKKQILSEFNSPFSERLPGDNEKRTLHGMFEAQVEKSRDTVAVTDASGHSLTYECLNEKANRLAVALRGKGVRHDWIVALETGRSVEVMVQLLAILKAGGGCLPIGSSNPLERTRYILNDSRARLILTADEYEADSPFSSLYGQVGTDVLSYKDILIDGVGNTILENTSSQEAGGLAYVLYTSGTTGKPKGVLMEHEKLINLLEFQYSDTSLDFSRVMHYAALTFDVSFQEIFSTLCSGGTLFLVREDMRALPEDLFAWVETRDIATIFLPTAFFKFIQGQEEYIGALPACVNHIAVAGEQLTVNDRLRRVMTDKTFSLHNHYGPTETHIVTVVTYNSGDPVPDLPPIGKPLPNTGMIIVDPYGFLQPVGIAGELFITGIQTARGYLNNPEMTSEKFFATDGLNIKNDRNHKNSLSSNRNEQSQSPLNRSFWESRTLFSKRVLAAGGNLIYKSGDLSRWLVDGNIEFLGRIDTQVKVRGFRVELGEIESLLINYNEVGEAAVVVMQDVGGEDILCGYVTGDVEGADLRKELGKVLPDYMVPSYIVVLEKLPVTANGKLDRRALPKPEIGGGELDMPVNDIQVRLQEIWADVLGVDCSVIGLDSGFFDLGGHSLKATLLVSRVLKEMNAAITLADVFKWQTIRGMAEYVRSSAPDVFHTVEPVETKEYYRLSPAQQRMLVAHRMNEDSTVYNVPLVVVLEGEIDFSRLERAVRDLTGLQEILRTSFINLNRRSYQRVHPISDIETVIAFHDATGLPQEEREQMVRDMIRPFDLEKPPLLRLSLLKTDPGEHVLVLDMPHIVTDGTSMGILINRLVTLYLDGDLSVPRLQYRDFAEWQTGEDTKRQETYWLEVFADLPPRTEMPFDFPRPVVPGFEGNSFRMTVDEHLTRRARSIAKEAESTIYMLLLAVLNVLLYKYTLTEDIVVGTGVAGRRHADLQDLVGMFINTLPLRNRPAGIKTFSKFLQEVRINTLAAFDNQEFPLEELINRLGLSGETGRNPLFDVEFVMQNYERIDSGTVLEGKEKIRVKPYTKLEAGVTKFDLGIEGLDTPEHIHMMYTYSTSLFKQKTIEDISGHFVEILTQVTGNPDILLENINLSTHLITTENDIDPEELEFGF